MAELKKENRKMKLFYKGKAIDLRFADKAFLKKLSCEKGYQHLFDKTIKNKKDGNNKL